MKLWLIRPLKKYRQKSPQRPEGRADANPWDPWYDKAFGFVVRAKDEDQARYLASQNAGDEGRDAWIKPEFSECEELRAKGEAEIVLRDFASA